MFLKYVKKIRPIHIITNAENWIASKGSLNRKMPSTRDMEGEIYSVSPKVSMGRLRAAAQNSHSGTADTMPARSSRTNFPLEPIATAPMPLPSIQNMTSKAMGAIKIVS